MPARQIPPFFRKAGAGPRRGAASGSSEAPEETAPPGRCPPVFFPRAPENGKRQDPRKNPAAVKQAERRERREERGCDRQVYRELCRAGDKRRKNTVRRLASSVGSVLADRSAGTVQPNPSRTGTGAPPRQSHAPERAVEEVRRPREVPAVLQNRKKEEKNQDDGQEPDNASHAAEQSVRKETVKYRRGTARQRPRRGYPESGKRRIKRSGRHGRAGPQEAR